VGGLSAGLETCGTSFRSVGLCTGGGVASEAGAGLSTAVELLETAVELSAVFAVMLERVVLFSTALEMVVLEMVVLEMVVLEMVVLEVVLEVVVLLEMVVLSEAVVLAGASVTKGISGILVAECLVKVKTVSLEATATSTQFP